MGFLPGRRARTVAAVAGTCLAALALTLVVLLGTGRPSSAAPSVDTLGGGGPEGEAIWTRDCAFCHGTRGEGSFQGPPITDAGTAAVDFMVRTGRMPAPYREGAGGQLSGDVPPAGRGRNPAAYDDAEIAALVRYTGSFVHGPEAVDEPDLGSADVAAGGSTYRLQCAACHQMAGSGGALAFGVVGPPLDQASPREVIEAMRTGPGNMPIFDVATVGPDQAVDVAAYVQYLKDPEDRGGASLGHLGPVPEGLVAWLVGIGATLLFCRWLGERQRVRRR